MASHQALSVVRGYDRACDCSTGQGMQAEQGFRRPERNLLAYPRLYSLQVAGWLGMSAEDALEETGAAADALFEKPRPNL